MQLRRINRDLDKSINWEKLLLTFMFFISFSIFVLYATTRSSEFNHSLNINSLMSIALILVSSFMLAFSVATENLQFVSMLFWMFELIFFGLTGYSYSQDTNPEYLAHEVSENSLFNAHILCMMSALMVAFLQLFFHFSKDDRSHTKFEYMQVDIKVVVGRLKKLSVIYSLTAPLVLLKIGGMGYLFKRGANSLNLNLDSLALQSIFESFILVVPLLITVSQILLSFNHDIKFNLLWRSAFLIWCLILANPLSHPRQTVFFMVVPLIYAAHKRFQIIGLLCVYGIPFILLYLSNVINRYTGQIQISTKIPILSRAGDLDAFPQLANGLDKVALGAFPIMHQILGSLFFFVPRQFWENKPLDTGVVLGQLSGLHFVNLSAPWVLEAFVNARWIGVILVAGLIGLYLGKTDESRSASLKIQTTHAIIAGSLFIVLRGSLLQATGRLALALLLTTLIFKKIPSYLLAKY